MFARNGGETFPIFEDFRALPPGLPTHRSSPHTSQPPPQSSSPLPFPYTSCPPSAAAPGPTQHPPSTCLLGWGLLTQQGHGRGAGELRFRKKTSDESPCDTPSCSPLEVEKGRSNQKEPKETNHCSSDAQQRRQPLMGLRHCVSEPETWAPSDF